MNPKGSRAAVRVYVGLLALLLGSVLVTTIQDPAGFDEDVPAWILLAALFALSEAKDVLFHFGGARQSLNPGEAILLPMLFALSFSQIVWAVVIVILVVGLFTWKIRGAKLLFNVAQYGCAAAAAVAVWLLLKDGTALFSLRNAAASAVAVVVFALLTFVLTMIAISLAEGRRAADLSRASVGSTAFTTFGSILMGWFLAAAYAAAHWMIVLFPVALVGLYVGIRAILRQSHESERVEGLLAATRALAAQLDLGDALAGFLKAVQEAASAARSVVVLSDIGGRYERGWFCSEVRGMGDVADLRRLEDDPLLELVKAVGDQGRLVVGQEVNDPNARLRDLLDASELVAVPLRSSEGLVGVLAVFDRVGADDFDEDITKLLDALANELLVSLDAYRLFGAVAEERERFGRIFAGSQEGICLLDSGGCVRAWNPALERITGHPAEQVMGRIWSDVVPVRDRSESRLHGDELVGVEPEEELELVTREGPSRWVSILAGPIGEAEGGGWVVLVRDVTAEHEVEEAKSDFLSTISHELRTPLTTIKGSLQVLSRGRDSLPEDLADQMITVTTRGAERLERLVMNLLAVSQLESGTMPLFPDQVSFDELVKERAEAMLADHARKVIELPDRPMVVRGDRERLAQAVEHLLDNARKFGGPEGEIVVRLEHYGGYARLSISDEGPGIPAGDRERIFERFTRLGDVLTRETQGAGVGLFIAKRSVEAMEGRIWVESTVGKSSTFHVEVPLAHPVAVPDEASSA